MRKFLGSPEWYWFGDLGLLVLRLGMGCMFIFHGLPKLVGGPEGWIEVGQVVTYFGLTTHHGIWGFLAGLIEFLGGVLLIIGLAVRGVCSLLALVMLAALVYHTNQGDEFLLISHTIENAVVFFALILTGPGRYSVDNRTYERFSDDTI